MPSLNCREALKQAKKNLLAFRPLLSLGILDHMNWDDQVDLWKDLVHAAMKSPDEQQEQSLKFLRRLNLFAPKAWQEQWEKDDLWEDLQENNQWENLWNKDKLDLLSSMLEQSTDAIRCFSLLNRAEYMQILPPSYRGDLVHNISIWVDREKAQALIQFLIQKNFFEPLNGAEREHLFLAVIENIQPHPLEEEKGDQPLSENNHWWFKIAHLLLEALFEPLLREKMYQTLIDHTRNSGL